MGFTGEETEQILTRIEMKLEEIEKEFNINIKRERARFGEDITFKVTVNKISETEHGEFPVTKESRDFLERCRGYRLMPDILFQEFNSPEGKIRIMGFSTRKKKYPIIYTKNGQKFKCTVAHIVSVVKANVQEYMI